MTMYITSTMTSPVTKTEKRLNDLGFNLQNLKCLKIYSPVTLYCTIRAFKQLKINIQFC